MIYVFDTSALINIRQNYLRSTGLFEHFWIWLLGLLHSGKIIVPDAVFLELQGKKRTKEETEASEVPQAQEDEFFKILMAEKIPPRKRDDAVDKQLAAIEEAIASVNSSLSPEDQEIMATAKVLGATLVTEEKPQETPPPKGSSKPYRMPGACQLPSIDVRCINMKGFIEDAAEGRVKANDLL